MLSVGNSSLYLQAIAEMGMIKAQGDREQAMSEAEWKQLSNLIENDRRERVSSMLLCQLIGNTYHDCDQIASCQQRHLICIRHTMLMDCSMAVHNCMILMLSRTVACQV